MTLDDYRKAVRRALGLSETDTAALPDDDVTAAVNAALKAISTDHTWHWLFATATGTTTASNNLVAVPAGYRRTIYFTVGDNTPLEERPLVELLDNDETESEPISFARAGDNFQLWPTPLESESYTHVYWRHEPALVNDADTPLIPDAWSPWVVAEAGLRLPLRTNSPARYELLREEAAGWLRRAHAEAKRKANAALPRIKRTKLSVWQEF